ncbi:MAG: LysR family transcriptional regulator [Rubrivivax sp.]
MKNFRTLDLNLLRVFDALMSEGSLTRAAESLSMTQPAASHALKRLHDWLGETMFVRSAGGMRPTPRAAALWPRVRTALQELEQALAPRAFDPARDPAQFRLAMADATAALLAPAMVAGLASARALADLRLVPLTTRDPRTLLLDAQIDLAIGSFPGVMSVVLADHERSPLHHTRLHQAPYVCAMRPGHPLTEGELTLDRFCSAEHLMVSLSGVPQGVVDDLLASLGRQRRVVLTVNQYHTAIRVLAASDLVAVLPASPATASGAEAGLVQRPLPLVVAPLTIEMIWLARREAEPAHRWLRRLVTEAAHFD